MITALSITGILLSLASYNTISSHIRRHEEEKLFGKIHLSTVGGLGYTMMAATKDVPYMTEVLAVGMALATVWLIWKALDIRLGYNICTAICAVNAMIVIVAFTVK